MIEALIEDTLPELAAAPARVLIADDQPDVLEALRLLLKGAGYEIETVSAPDAVIRSLESRDFDVILMDLNYARDTTSGREGLDLLGRIRAISDDVPVVVMTAWSTVPIAVEAMRRGVRDFVEKPWDNTQLLATLNAQVERARREREYRRLEKLELEMAAETERGLLPREIPRVPGYDISVWTQPMGGIGGDYFDARRVDDGSVALAIGDVSGKGMSAALLMSNLQAAVKACALERLAPAELCERVNGIIHGNLAAEKFVTFFYARLEVAANRLDYANAGHNAPILVRRSGEVTRLGAGGPVLGVFAHSDYSPASVALEPCDRLVLFTDGLTEARNRGGEEFGEDRLVELLAENRTKSAGELRDQVLDALRRFSDRGFQDDATLIVVAVQ